MDKITTSVKWVDAQWVKSNLDSSLLVLDIQPDIHDYIKEHIPGAVYFNENHFRAYKKNLPALYTPQACIVQLLGQVGLSQNQPVLIYSSNGGFSEKGDGLEQSMAAYSLCRFGHSPICILNGGLQSWIDAGFPLSKEFPLVQSTSIKLNINNDLQINYSQLLEKKDQSNTVLVDVRPRSVYQGEALWSKPGHIPGAINLPWRMLTAHNNPRLIRSVNFISELAHSHNITADKSIILYCGTGREATTAFLIFKYLLNYPDVKIYEGSFTEWVSIPGNPTVSGPHPY